ncbi:MAG TPA: MBL fold metallo-hydrolase, partial [Stellaceae bacterium]|nr:MBL fold metallo-hydrolase [Stellaceae bacterium]
MPGAYAGSVCGRRLIGKPVSTIGFERHHNAAFRIAAEDAFIEFMLKDIPPAPPEAAALRAWNAGPQAVAAQ